MGRQNRRGSVHPSVSALDRLKSTWGNLETDEQVEARKEFVIKFCETPFEERKEFEVLAMLSIVEDVKFFKELGENMRSELCRVMKYVRKPEGTTLFKKGDSGDTFYIIFKGLCHVIVPSKNEGEPDLQIPLGHGVGFGELALVNDEPRAATVAVVETTEFLTIDKDAYVQTLRDVYVKQVIALMGKASEDRTEDDLRLLLDLTKGLQFFESRPMERRLQLCRVVRYEKYAEGQVLFRKGEKGSTFYITISGTVEVLVAMPDGTEASVAKLGPGTSFGELALLGSGLRNATIRAVTEAQFMTIERKDYTAILKAEQAKELQAKIKKLISLFPAFVRFDSGRMATLSTYFNKIEVAAGETVARQGGGVAAVYFVLEGECSAVLNMDYRSGNSKMSDSVMPRQQRVKKALELAKISVNDSFGEIEAYSGDSDPEWCCSITATHPTILLSIGIGPFRKRIPSFMTADRRKAAALKAESWADRRDNGIEVMAMNGFELASELPQIPEVFLEAEVTDDAADSGMSAGGVLGTTKFASRLKKRLEAHRAEKAKDTQFSNLINDSDEEQEQPLDHEGQVKQSFDNLEKKARSFAFKRSGSQWVKSKKAAGIGKVDAVALIGADPKLMKALNERAQKTGITQYQISSKRTRPQGSQQENANAENEDLSDDDQDVDLLLRHRNAQRILLNGPVRDVSRRAKTVDRRRRDDYIQKEFEKAVRGKLSSEYGSSRFVPSSEHMRSKGLSARVAAKHRPRVARPSSMEGSRGEQLQAQSPPAELTRRRQVHTAAALVTHRQYVNPKASSQRWGSSKLSSHRKSVDAYASNIPFGMTPIDVAKEYLAREAAYIPHMPSGHPSESHRASSAPSPGRRPRASGQQSLPVQPVPSLDLGRLGAMWEGPSTTASKIYNLNVLKGQLAVDDWGAVFSKPSFGAVGSRPHTSRSARGQPANWAWRQKFAGYSTSLQSALSSSTGRLLFNNACSNTESNEQEDHSSHLEYESNFEVVGVSPEKDVSSQVPSRLLDSLKPRPLGIGKQGSFKLQLDDQGVDEELNRETEEIMQAESKEAHKRVHAIHSMGSSSEIIDLDENELARRKTPQVSHNSDIGDFDVQDVNPRRDTVLSFVGRGSRSNSETSKSPGITPMQAMQMWDTENFGVTDAVSRNVNVLQQEQALGSDADDEVDDDDSEEEFVSGVSRGSRRLSTALGIDIHSDILALATKNNNNLAHKTGMQDRSPSFASKHAALGHIMEEENEDMSVRSSPYPALSRSQSQTLEGEVDDLSYEPMGSQTMPSDLQDSQEGSESSMQENSIFGAGSESLEQQAPTSLETKDNLNSQTPIIQIDGAFNSDSDPDVRIPISVVENSIQHSQGERSSSSIDTVDGPIGAWSRPSTAENHQPSSKTKMKSRQPLDRSLQIEAKCPPMQPNIHKQTPRIPQEKRPKMSGFQGRNASRPVYFSEASGQVASVDNVNFDQVLTISSPGPRQQGNSEELRWAPETHYVDDRDIPGVDSDALRRAPRMGGGFVAANRKKSDGRTISDVSRRLGQHSGNLKPMFPGSAMDGIALAPQPSNRFVRPHGQTHNVSRLTAKRVQQHAFRQSKPDSARTSPEPGVTNSVPSISTGRRIEDGFTDASSLSHARFGGLATMSVAAFEPAADVLNGSKGSQWQAAAPTEQADSPSKINVVPTYGMLSRWGNKKVTL